MELKFIKPSITFLFTVLLFNILPGLYIYITHQREGLYRDMIDHEYDVATKLYIWTVFSFLICYIISLFFFKLTLFHKTYDSHGTIQKSYLKDKTLFIEVIERKKKFLYSIDKLKMIRNMAITSSFFVWLYFVFGGYEKLTTFGSDMDEWEYRIIGYGDRNGALTAILELSRKIFLPFSCIFLLNYKTISNFFPSRNEIYFYLFTLLLAGLMTMDRGPILLLCVMLIFKRYSLGANAFTIFMLPILLLSIVIGVAGFVTFIQYNITQFSVEDIFNTGINFFWHRTVIVPSVASIELSFYLFPEGSEKLFLQFSRLGALFGGTYIDIRNDDLSVYVAPVGFIADCWRNFGFIGCLILGIFLGFYFAYLDILLKNLDPLAKIASSFTAISLCFYYIFGVFFSQGVFAQMIFLVFIMRVLKIKKQNINLPDSIHCTI